MTATDLPQALQALLTETRADAAVVAKSLDAGARGYVVAAEPACVAVGSPWPTSPAPGTELFVERDPARLGALVPTALRLGLASPPRAALSAALGGGSLSLVLVWCSGDAAEGAADVAADVAARSIQDEIAALAAREDEYQSLAAENARLILAVDALDQAVITIDDLRQVAHVNPAAARLLDLPQDQVSATQVAAALRALQQRAANRDEVEAVAAALRTNPQARVTRAVWSFAGTPSHLRVSTAPIDRPGLSGRAWVFDDISSEMAALETSERARVEIASAEARERLLLENSADVAFLGTNEGVLEWLSSSVVTLLGREADDLVGTPFATLVHPDDLPAVRAVQHSLLQGVEGRFEARLRRADDSWLWVSVIVRPIFDAAGRVTGRMGGWRDIQAKVQARQELQRARDQLRATADGMLDPQALLGAVRDAAGHIVDFRYLDVNRAACAYLSLDREALVGTNVTDSMPGLAAAGLLAGYIRTVESGEPLVLDDIPYANEVLGETRRYDIRGARVGDGLTLTWRDVSDRSAAAAALAASEAKLSAILEHAAEGITMLDLSTGRYTYVSPRMEEMTGFTMAELNALSGEEIFARGHPDERDAAARELLRVAAGELDVVVVEYRWQVRSGEYRWFRDSRSVMRDPDGAPVALVSVMTDIDERVRLERALGASEARFRTVFADAPLGIALIDSHSGEVKELNQRFAEIAGRTRDEMLTIDWMSITHPDDVQMDLDQMARLNAGEIPGFHMDKRYLKPDGAIVWISMTIAPLRESDGSHTQHLCMIDDITERRRQQEALRRHVAELDALQHMSALLVQRVDLATAVDGVCALLATLLQARSVEPRMAPDDVGEIVATQACAPDEGCALTLPLAAHDETLGTLTVRRDENVGPFTSAEQSLVHTAADLLAAVIWTERLHALETEQAATGERKRIARDLHDAVTQSIYSANLIAEGLPPTLARDPGQALEDVAVIRRLIRAAFAELRILLYELRPETLALSPLETLLQRLGDALSGQGETEVELDVDPQVVLPPEVRTVFYRVAQEALNNVGKYARAAQVTVSFAADDGHARLTVCDDGLGFDLADHPPGMGQGIMRERAESIGARLSVASAPGAGTTVALDWPLPDESVSPVAHA